MKRLILIIMFMALIVSLAYGQMSGRMTEGRESETGKGQMMQQKMMGQQQFLGDMMNLMNTLSSMMRDMSGTMKNVTPERMKIMSGIMKDMSNQMSEMSEIMEKGIASEKDMEMLKENMNKMQLRYRFIHMTP